MHFPRTVLVLPLFLCLSATCFAGDCDKRLIGEGQVFGIVVGGRATGSYLPIAARELGYETVHIYPDGLADSIVNSFGTVPDQYTLGAISYADPRTLEKSIGDFTSEARARGLRVAGFSAGMDYGVNAADSLSAWTGTAGNDPAFSQERTNKGLLNQHLEGQGVSVPQSVSLSLQKARELAPFLHYPVFIKPDESWGSIGASTAHSAEELTLALRKLESESSRMRHTVSTIALQQALYPDAVYFIDTASSIVNGEQRRQVTGIWVDMRGEDYPKEVWDRAFMVPPSHLLSTLGKQFTSAILQANEAVLSVAKVTVGSTHLEFMASRRLFDFSELLAETSAPLELSAGALLPTDLNLRLPGLRCPHLELRTTGINPYQLDILSHAAPDRIQEGVYSQWNEFVGLVFLRTKSAGTVSARGREWLLSQKRPTPDRGYVVDDRMVAAVGTQVEATRDGSTMVGTLQIAAPTYEALVDLYDRIREKERQGYFVDSKNL